ncbi:uncharacterized protein [Aquarana catesbeiana]|uniref:uncharacterized protein isoform X2 n=1 Tax=Aquarana catesbeiana TaxID=8400 RepID=UPI003CC930E9
MKMAGHGRFLVLFPLLGALLLGAGAQQKPLKLVGSEVIMEPKYTGNPSEINWKINGNKLVDMELNSQDEPTFYRLGDRATIDRTNGRLTIRDLTTGDSGDYRAEALVNNVYQYTDITLTVRACPDEPKITNQTTEENIVLTCKSFTLGVTYEWFNQTGSVGKEQSYSEPRPKNYDVNLTCVVDNEVCKKSSSILIRYIPEKHPVPVGTIIVIFVVLLLVLLILFAIALLHHHREKPHVKGIYSALTRSGTFCTVFVFEKVHYVLTCCKARCMVIAFDKVYYGLTCCKGNATDVEGQPLLNQSEQIKMVGSEVTLEPKCSGDPSEINWKINGNKLVDMKLNTQDEPTFYCLQDRADIDRTDGRLTIRDLTIEDSGVYKAEALVNNGYQNTEITLTVRERCTSITVKFQTKDQPKGKVKQCLTIHNVKPEDHDCYALEVLQSDGKKSELDIEETDGIVIIRIKDDRVTLTVPDTEKVTKMTWKKGGVTLFQWAVSGLKLYTNNITLKPGFVSVNNAKGEASYEVEVHSTDNTITNNALQQEANIQGNESPTNNTLEVEEVPLTENANIQGNESPTNNTLKVEEVPFTENDLPENQPIGSVIFHPINVTDKITLKKDGEPVNTNDRINLSPHGDLIINNVTSDDKGKYTIQCEDQKLEQEFILCMTRLEGPHMKA